MPAVMNTMCAPAIASSMRSRSARATARASSGFAPAPSPLEAELDLVARLVAPKHLRVGVDGDELHASTPCSIMWLIALPPAPPTPITLMIGPVA
jgi:hypothetical protein